MINVLRGYPENKPSVLPWFGDVPAHWEVRKLRHCGSISGGLTPSMSDRSLWDGELPWVTPKDMKRFTISSASMNVAAKALEVTSLRLIPSPAVLMVTRGMILARRVPVARTDQAVTINQDMKAIVPVSDVDAGFLAYRLEAAQEAFVPMIDEAGHGTKRFPTERWKELQVALPPLDEQRMIVRFLDWHGAQTAKLVRAKTKIIALLNEQKQAIIHRAVTRGLDPNAKLKPSGIPWLSDVPEGWRVFRLRHLIRGRLTYGANSAAEFSNPDWPRYIRITDFRSDGSLRAETFRSLPPEIAVHYIVEPGDILFARSGATVGKAFLVTTGTGQACHAGYLIRARPLASLVLPEYLYAFTQSQAFFAWKELTFNTATIQNIGADKYANLAIPLPPIDQQGPILQAIKTEQAPLLVGVRQKEREIALIQEFRTRLVADVVTGKLDVRAVAATLPDVTEIEPIDDLAEVDDLDETVDDAESEEVAA